MRKLFLIILITCIIILIYVLTYKDSNLSFSFGLDDDINYDPIDYRITDIILDIENNIDIDGYKIQNLLVKANTISINLDKYIKVYDYPMILDQMDDLETLYSILRKYSKETISVKLLNEKNILYEYTNKKIILLSKKYDIMVMR